MCDKDSGGVVDVKMERADDDTKLDDLAKAFEDLDFEEGNFITFTKPDDLATSHGEGSIETGRFARAIIVRPLPPRNTRAPTHSMFARADTGKYFKVADMWLNKAKGSGNPYFNFKANTPGLNVAGNVYSRPEGKWEIVFKAEAKCGTCGVACGPCARRG